MVGELTEQVIGMSQPVSIRDDHSCEQSDHASGENSENTDDRSRDLEVLQLRRFDFTIDLSQGLEAAHGEERVSESHNYRDRRHAQKERILQPTGALIRKCQVCGRRQGRNLRRTAYKQSDRAPYEKHDDHDSRDLHDAERFSAGLVNTPDVASPEVRRDDKRKKHREERRSDMNVRVQLFADFVKHVSQVLARADCGDRTRQNVVEDEC